MKDAPAKLQVRMDRQLKEAAEEIFSEIGIDATTAVRMFYTKVARTRSIPFLLMADPEFTPEQEERILKAMEESHDPKNLSKPHKDVAKMFRDMRAEIATES